ncbi:hypothetical protein LTR86_010821 [Recurvomyces mirabilis]|nr:hypothetical protein LTR86_010821 [Recurvomyces mirabilis]
MASMAVNYQKPMDREVQWPCRRLKNSSDQSLSAPQDLAARTDELWRLFADAGESQAPADSSVPGSMGDCDVGAVLSTTQTQTYSCGSPSRSNQESIGVRGPMTSASTHSPPDVATPPCVNTLPTPTTARDDHLATTSVLREDSDFDQRVARHETSPALITDTSFSSSNDDSESEDDMPRKPGLRQRQQRSVRISEPPAVSHLSDRDITTCLHITGDSSSSSERKILIELPVSALLSLLAAPSPAPAKEQRAIVSRAPPYTETENRLLIRLKERSRPQSAWRTIAQHFPGRSTNSLQVHYSTHLKRRRPRRGAEWGR